MIKWTRTSRLSIKISLSEAHMHRPCDLGSPKQQDYAYGPTVVLGEGVGFL
jgi:hypothetical protein